MQFSINTKVVAGQCNRLEDVEGTEFDIENKLQGIRDGLSGLSLDEVRPAIDALITRLAKNKNSVVNLKDALNRIIKLYYQAENAIKGYGITSIDVMLYADAQAPSLLDYSDLMEQYGLSDTELRYIQGYYPELLEELRNSSNPDDVLNRINSILDKDHISMMDDYGYSYEAIKYLKDNWPGMIGSLYATSHWSSADVKKVREAIYNLCHKNDICVYDPNYDFDSYNFNPSNSTFTALYHSVQLHTNCYAYAFGLSYDPRTGEMLPRGGLQPGYLSGQFQSFLNDYDIVFSRDDNGKKLVEYITADVEAIDLNFVPYEEGMTGGQRVALVINPSDNTDGIVDYHWYFYDEESGTWFNKQGGEPSTDCYMPDVSDGTDYSEQTNYPDDYNLYIDDGHYYVASPENPIGADYMEHAESCGYSVNVGEFYITRQDGGTFQ